MPLAEQRGKARGRSLSGGAEMTDTEGAGRGGAGAVLGRGLNGGVGPEWRGGAHGSRWAGWRWAPGEEGPGRPSVLTSRAPAAPGPVSGPRARPKVVF